MKLASALGVVSFALLSPILAAAQSSKDSQTPPAPIKLGSVIVQGSVRIRVYGWDWFQAPPYQNSYAYPGTLIRLSFSQRRRAFDWNFELAAPVLLNLPTQAVAPAPQGLLGLGATYFAVNHNSQNSANVFPKQAYVRFHHLGRSGRQSLQVGRFEFLDGNEVTPVNPTLASLKRDRILQRLVGPFGFSDVQRSLDGFHYVYSTPKLDFTAVGSIPTRGVFQTDGWGWLHTGLIYTSLTGQVRAQQKAAAEWRIFSIYYHDWRHVLKADNRTGAVRMKDMGNIRIGTFGGHYLQTAKTPAGTLDFLSWGALQTGRWGALVHRAGVFAVEAGVQPNVAKTIRPWVRMGYLYGSGDGDSSDNKHSTFFPLLYSRFPIFNFMNSEDGYVGLVLRPSSALTIRSDVHTLRLTHANDLWYLAGGLSSLGLSVLVVAPATGRGVWQRYMTPAFTTLSAIIRR